MKSVKCYPIGTKVQLAEDIEGTITALGMRGNGHVTYEVEWWNGRTRCEGWFHESQVTPITGEKSLRIGFLAHRAFAGGRELVNGGH